MKNKTLINLLITSGVSLITGGIVGFILGRKTVKSQKKFLKETEDILEDDLDKLITDFEDLNDEDEVDWYNMDDIWEDEDTAELLNQMHETIEEGNNLMNDVQNVYEYCKEKLLSKNFTEEQIKEMSLVELISNTVGA